MRTNDGLRAVRETDTHRRVKQGFAAFNWRLLFDINIPLRSPILKIVAFSDYVIATDVAIGEATLDLGPDLAEVFRAKTTKLDYGEVKLPLTLKGRTTGVLHLNVTLLPKDLSRLAPVGQGREEPNREPFLDPEDKHLLKGRALMTNNAVFDAVASIGGWAWFLAKYAIIGKILAYVGAVIFGSVVTLKAVGFI